MNKKYLSVVALIICLASLFAVLAKHRRWTAKSTSVESAVSQLRLTRLSSSFGFLDLALLGADKLIAVGTDTHTKQVFVSSDGGRNWAYRNIPTEGCSLNSVQFLDPSHGWAAGCAGLVLFSRDSGESWKRLPIPAKQNLNLIKFTDSKTGYTTSRPVNNCQIYKTIDGGKQWTKVFESPEDDGSAFDLASPGGNVILVAINDDYLLRTQDGGQTWRKVESRLSGASSVTFTEDGTGWVVGRNGCFFRSDDKGLTWQRPVNLPAEFSTVKWWSIGFADAKRGVAVGEEGRMAYTFDGGKTWTNSPTGTIEPLTKILFAGDKGFIFGQSYLYAFSYEAERH